MIPKPDQEAASALVAETEWRTMAELVEAYKSLQNEVGALRRDRNDVADAALQLARVICAKKSLLGLSDATNAELDALLASLEVEVAAMKKVPLAGTLTKSGLRRLMQHNRWDIIGAYFNFAPKFLTLPSNKPVFDWTSCPTAMTALLQQTTRREEIREKERIRRSQARPKRQLFYEQQNGECYYCGEPTEIADWTLDHKMPVSRGGKHRGNVVGCCQNCNKAKGNMTVAEFLATDFLTDSRRAILGANGAPAVSFQAAKQRHNERLRGA